MIATIRRQYPLEWESLARECKERSNWQCEQCGAKQYSIATSKKGTPYFIYLHAAHKNHDKQNPTPELLCLCCSCHARYDYQQRERQKRILLEQLKHLKLLLEQGMITLAYELAVSDFE